ncbi:MAG: damage-inducible protein DinB [Gammaproteobacteria bacterium]|nr:MAG: damage-inducible protein DinB [Gammaproteobacteria bacterium]
MNIQTHFQLMGGYNRRMNRQVYGVAAKLDQESLCRDAGAFFRSILGTLNHIMVGDLLWLRRFRGHRDGYFALDELGGLPRPQGLDEILFADFSALWSCRESVDEIVVRWLETETGTSDFADNLTYANSKGVVSTRNFGELLCHFFNHQTHHRGQVSTLLSQMGCDIGVTDFLIDIPDLDTVGSRV